MDLELDQIFWFSDSVTFLKETFKKLIWKKVSWPQRKHEKSPECEHLTLYLRETPFNAFANIADPDQAALVRAAWSGSTLFAYGNMISDPTLEDMTSNFFVLCTNMQVYLYNYS